jgi:uncharacterized protein
VRGQQGTPWALTEAEKRTYLDDLEGVGREVVSELKAGRVPRDDRFSHRVLQLLAGMERDAFCGAGEVTFGITPTGEVLPCVLLAGDGCRLGHVDDDPEVWRGAGRRWRQSRAQASECEGCPARRLCGGGCPALMPVCGVDECEYVRKNCEIATHIFQHFQDEPVALLALAGVT